MARSKGTLSLSSNIEPSMNAPLDARTVVNTLADLTDSGSFPYFYEGMIVSCKANKKVYQLIGNDPTDEENWQEVGSSGGSEVSITPVLTSGRKIADFEIDGEAGELYAPSASGGGCGSLFVITTQDSDLMGRTVTITDEDSNQFTGVFDNTGYCEISGVSSIGTLTISATDTTETTATATVTVQYYSKYTAELIVPSIKSLLNVDFDTAYNYIGQFVDLDTVQYERTFFHFQNGGIYDAYYSTSSSTAISSLAYNSGMTQRKIGSGSFDIGNVTVTSDGGPYTYTFNRAGAVVLSYVGGDVNSMNAMKNYSTAFNVIPVEAGDTITAPYTSGSIESTWISYYPKVYNTVALVPTMTSDTTPSGQVIYSSVWQDGTGAYKSWYAFDGNDSTGWAGTIQTGNYIGYHFENPVKVTKAYMVNQQQGTSASFRIQASNDGTNWTSVSDVITYGGSGNPSIFNVEVNTDGNYYTYYRLYNTDAVSTTANTYTLQFYGYEV